jgi:hypothetical protein
MSVEQSWLCVVMLAFVSIAPGCKPKDREANAAGQASGPSPEQVAAGIEALTKDMREVGFGDLNHQHVGRQCVVVVPTPDPGSRPKGSPPPIGMVRRMGPTTAYKAEIQSVSPDGLKIRAAYPSSGEYKFIEISPSDIQSIYLGD